MHKVRDPSGMVPSGVAHAPVSPPHNPFVAYKKISRTNSKLAVLEEVDLTPSPPTELRCLATGVLVKRRHSAVPRGAGRCFFPPRR